MADTPTIAAQITAALKPLGTVYRNTVPIGMPPPWLIFFKVSGQDTSTFDTADTGASYARYQIDAWATDPTAAARLSAAARAALRAVLVVGEITDNPDEPGEGDATGMHRASFDLTAWL